MARPTRHPCLHSILLCVVAISAWLLVLAPPAVFGQGVFDYPADPDFVVLEYLQFSTMLGNPDPHPLLRIYGDGRVQARVPAGARQDGSGELYLTHRELRSLLARFEGHGVLDFDPVVVSRQRDQVDASRRSEGVELLLPPDSTRFVLSVNLRSYTPVDGGSTFENFKKEVTWIDAEAEARRYRGVEALQGLAAAERELLDLVRRGLTTDRPDTTTNPPINDDLDLKAACLVTDTLPTNQWKMISLPCDTGVLDTVQDVFGDDLVTGDYGTRWAVFERQEELNKNRRLFLSEPMDEGTGYWIKTLDSDQSISVDGVTNNPIDVPLVSDPAGIQNLVGNPFTFDEVCWADVEVIDGVSTLSLDQADPLIGMVRACDMDPPDASCVMSRVASKWNGSAYETFDGETLGVEGTLYPFDGLWVKAFKSGISLRIPATPGVDCTTCLPIVIADAGADTCSGGPVTIGTAALADHTYSWSPGGETTAQITVSPSVTTTYTVTATTVCGSVQDSVTVLVDGLVEDFEGDVSAWTATGLWHLTNNSTCPAPQPGASSPTHAFYYGQDGTCTYDTGAANAGTLTSPVITGITTASELSFDYFYQGENDFGFDFLRVDVIGSTTQEVFATEAEISEWMASGQISLAAFAGQDIQIQFKFDTEDDQFNANLGALIDNVRVTNGNPCVTCNLAGDFESGAPGWTVSGDFWHLTDDSLCADPTPGYSSPTHAFYYGQDATCDFDSGVDPNSGTLTSPLLTGISATSNLSFMYLRDAETFAVGTELGDFTLVKIISGGSPTTVLNLVDQSATTWTSSGQISLAQFAGQAIQVRFEFDSVDDFDNTGFGWFVDDVNITGNLFCEKSLAEGASQTAIREIGAAKAPVAKAPSSNDPRNWFVRLSVVSGDLRDDDNVLGQLEDAADGYDYHDLPELFPFDSRYLSIVFPHDDWEEFSGDYTSDFQAPDPPLRGEWRFDVIGAGMDGDVTLSWTEQGTALHGWWLLDEATGERIRVESGGSHTFQMVSGTRRSFRWFHGGAKP